MDAKNNPQSICINDFDYSLPEDRVAKYPLPERDSSKLLVFREGKIEDVAFSRIGDFLPDNSLMVFNNTKVIQARMFFRKPTGALIEIFCLEPHAPSDYQLNFQQNKACSWVCLIGNLKKWKEGTLAREIEIGEKRIFLKATQTSSLGGSHIINFSWDDETITFSDILESGGELPIPPYLNRETEEEDKQTYQTVYSKIEGSVAAPTAGLHFTGSVLDFLKAKGMNMDEVTLHVGAGTFRPVKTPDIGSHEMHAEFISVKKELIERLLKHKGKIIAVGTTSVRTLESLYYVGLFLEKNKGENHLEVSQWIPYTSDERIDKKKALTNILAYLDNNGLKTLTASTKIIIVPGYEFKIVDGIVTNFHQPKSTLLLLVSAFTGKKNREYIYNHALENNYRFLSYGDSSLLLKA